MQQSSTYSRQQPPQPWINSQATASMNQITNQSHHQNASYRQSTSLSQSRHQLFQANPNGSSISHVQSGGYPYRMRPTEISNADSIMGIRNQNQLSSSSIYQNQNQLLFSPSQLDDQNRLFAFYNPSDHEIFSPQAFGSNNSVTQAFQIMGSAHQLQSGMTSPHEDLIGSSGGLQRDILQHQLDVMQHLQQQQYQQQQQQKQNRQQSQIDYDDDPNVNRLPTPPQKEEKIIDTEKELVDQKLKRYSSIVMQQTFFNHLSLQIFFVLVLVIIIYQLHYTTVLIFLWIVDVISFTYSFKRSKIEIEVDPSKIEDMSNVWRVLETFFSIIFKICLYIYMEVDHYKFYYVPCSLLVYVLIRFFFVISKKLTENGPISNLLNESFTWGFKIFFVGQLFLISVKMGDKIDWAWQDVFWPYWVFFYIMIGTNSVFVILLLSKVLLKCLGQPVESFEIKGLFWFFMVSNGLCVNSTLFVRGLISYLENLNEADALKAFKYSVCFICTFIVYTLLFWKGIWIFMFHFSQDRDELDADNSELRGDTQMRSSRSIKRRGNPNSRSTHNNSKQSQPTGSGVIPHGEDGEEDEEQGYEDADEEDDEEEIYAEGDIYSYNNTGNDRQQIDQGINPQEQQKKKKTFKKVNLSFKGNEKKGIPLFLEKLSSTYFTVLTNNGMKKRKKDGINQNDSFKSKSLSKSTLNDKNSSPTTNKKSNGKKEVNAINKSDIQRAGAVNKSDIQSAGAKKQTRSKKQSLQKIQSKKDSKQLQFESPKGLSDSVRQIEISFNEEGAKKIAPPNNDKNSLQRIAYETQLKFSQMIQSPKGQELKKKEQEKKLEYQESLGGTKKEVGNRKQTTKEETQDNNHDESNACCVICFENEPDTVYLPCGHGGICYECGMDVLKKTGECYLCRNEINQVVQIDFKSKDSQKKVIAVTSALEEKTDCNEGDTTMQNRSNPNVSGVQNQADQQQQSRDMQDQASHSEAQEYDLQLEPAIYGGRQQIEVQARAPGVAADNESDQNQQLNSSSFEIEKKKIELMSQIAEEQNANGMMFSSGREESHSEKKCINSQMREGQSDQYLINIGSSEQ